MREFVRVSRVQKVYSVTDVSWPTASRGSVCCWHHFCSGIVMLFPIYKISVGIITRLLGAVTI